MFTHFSTEYHISWVNKQMFLALLPVPTHLAVDSITGQTLEMSLSPCPTTFLLLHHRPSPPSMKTSSTRQPRSVSSCKTAPDGS